ncbi:unnamed protein product [Rotaria sordida]|uniref:Uncharacterized protein n=1 Tax=Rotaria sordida TaxID=392033 RepID=A0A814PHJ1_9BILA|nr:unnamed protein product [Rotaria sordida]
MYTTQQKYGHEIPTYFTVQYTGDSTLQMNSSTQVVVEQKDIDGEQEDSGVDAFDILAEVIQENKPRIMSEQEPEVLKITDYLKK